MTTPEQQERPRFQSERQAEIIELILDRGRAEVADLADRFAVTTETIRRDLSDLDRRGLVRRVHGGAIPMDSLRHEPLLAVRNQQMMSEKRRIGRSAAAELPMGGTAIIDSGSTTTGLCEAVPADAELTVVTNSLLNAQLLADRSQVEIILVGGTVRKSRLAAVDATTADDLGKMRVDVAFLGSDGVSALHGLSTPYQDEAAVKQAMMGAARRTVALLDSTKFGNDQLFQVAPCSAVDLIVTDDGVDDVLADAIEVLGTAVRRA